MKQTKLNWGKLAEVFRTDLLDKTNIAKFLSQETVDILNSQISSCLEELLNSKLSSKTKEPTSFKNMLVEDENSNLFFMLSYNVYKDMTLLSVHYTPNDILEIREYGKEKTIVIKTGLKNFTLKDNGDGTYNYRKEGLGGVKLLDKHGMTKSAPVKGEKVRILVGPVGNYEL